MKFILNRKGVGELMKSDEMLEVLNSKASNIRERCGEGYQQNSHIGRQRANAMVYPETFRAKADNLKNNTILKAVIPDD